MTCPSGTSSHTSWPVTPERSANDVAVSSTSSAPCLRHQSKISERANPAQIPETSPWMFAPFKARPGLRTRFLFLNTEHTFPMLIAIWEIRNRRKMNRFPSEANRWKLSFFSQASHRGKNSNAKAVRNGMVETGCPLPMPGGSDSVCARCPATHRGLF